MKDTRREDDSRGTDYLVAQACGSLQKSFPGVLVHNQPPSLRRDRTKGGGLHRGGLVQLRHLWQRSAVRLWLQGRRR